MRNGMGGRTVEHETLREHAHAWFADRAPRRAEVTDAFDVSVFHDLAADDERELLERLCRWHQDKWDAGLAGLDWSQADGGLGREAAGVVEEVEGAYATPTVHELFSVTVHLVAPTVRLFGTDEQKARFLRTFARAEELCVQLFSEPGAGSDLAGLSTRARRTEDGWRVDGQKVWSSGAQFAAYGLLIARSDEDAVKHAGLTAFLVPMDAPGVTVRPLRQMSGGSSFCEVFLDDVHLDDALRVGEVGQGWKVATTTLSFERDTSGSDTTTGGSWEQVLELARTLGRTDDARTRPALADLYLHHRLAEVAAARDLKDREDGLPQGPVGSMRKLQWVEGLMRTSDVVTDLLGGRLVADTGQERTYAWTAHVLGAPGYRIAGGTDEIQRSIIAERMLGLPAGPKLDRGRPWREIPR
ncbi:acyl-CoA dehydrogenase [Nitriliruptoraceae bacterium ZYF776]|nr:acyl-CoA dehydrogenase [Profundirhabdus halotolerans]